MESEVISARCPFEGIDEFRLLSSPSQLVFIKTIPQLNRETVFRVPLRSAIWITQAIYRFLVPARDGGFPGDDMSHEAEIAGIPIRVRRSPNCGAPDEFGFIIMNCASEGYQPGYGFPTFQLTDRLLFDHGFYTALCSIAEQVDEAKELERLRHQMLTIRPNWMGKSPSETPAPRA